jgi:hypothetical protein
LLLWKAKQTVGGFGMSGELRGRVSRPQRRTIVKALAELAATVRNHHHRYIFNDILAATERAEGVLMRERLTQPSASAEGSALPERHGERS